MSKTVQRVMSYRKRRQLGLIVKTLIHVGGCVLLLLLLLLDV